MRTRATWGLVAAGLVLAGVTSVALLRPGLRPAGAPPAPDGPRLGTVEVVRTDVVQRQQVAGTLGFRGDVEVINPGGRGILTWVPAPGATVTRGAPLFEVDGVKARLMLGTRPAWREFSVGMRDGVDVLQLERNLVALGYTGFTVDRAYTAATAAAVGRWRTAAATGRWGTVPLGSVIFLPSPVRVVAPVRGVGAPVEPGVPVLRGTSPTRAVNAVLPTAQRGGVAVGNEVYVTLPDGQRLAGRVTEVGRVVAGTDPDGPGAGPTVALTVTLAPPSAGGPDPTAGLDEVPVVVSVTVRRARQVLAVPVTALVAALGGGYEVVAVSAAGRRPIGVEPGLLDDITGLIEVSGAGLAAGQRVEVPVP
jgi:hypothetical protein